MNTFKCHSVDIWIPDLGYSINHTFCTNLPAPLLQVSPVWNRAHQASHTAKAGDDWLVPICGCDRSCLLQRKGGGSNHCDPVLQSAGLHAEPSPAWHWENATVCLAREKVMEAGRHFLKTSISPAAPRHSWEGAAAAATASAAALAQPRDIYVLPQPGSQPVPFYFFPLRKHPQKGNERLQPFLQILVQTVKKTFKEWSCFYRYLLPWKVHYLPSTSILL